MTATYWPGATWVIVVFRRNRSLAQQFPSSPLSGRSMRLTVATLVELWLLLGAAEAIDAAGPARATAVRVAAASPGSATRLMVRINCLPLWVGAAGTVPGSARFAAGDAGRVSAAASARP